MKKYPPRLLRALFHFLCPKERKEEIEGDFNEVYEKALLKKGRLKANLNYCSNVLSLLNFKGYLSLIDFSSYVDHLRLIFKLKLRSNCQAEICYNF